jgi:salicylate hydroxylase
VVDFTDDGDGIEVITENGARYQGDVLVGCDGIHSKVRERLFGRDAPRFTGVVAWRATIPIEQLPPNHVRPMASNWLGQGGHFVHYYLRRGELVNCVGCFETAEWQAESWSAVGEKKDFARDFAGWHEDLQVLIRNAENCFRWGLFDRDPMPAWSRGRVTLLGDACHPMLPFMAQGAVMSIEDGCILTACLDAIDDPEAALRMYESVRRERTADVQQMSRDNMKIFHDAAAATETILAGHRARHEWLYGYDATAQI